MKTKALLTALALAFAGHVVTYAQTAVTSGFEKLDKWAADCDMVNCKVMAYESISISGHKFFGIDSPCGLFITSREVYDNQTTFDVPYLNANMRMINCSRSGVEPIKFWWLIQTIGDEGWSRQAAQIKENTRYLKAQLERKHWPCWQNQYSNTVLFKRPSDKVVAKYNLACGEAFGQKVSHIVVMQHVTRQAIDQFIADLE